MPSQCVWVVCARVCVYVCVCTVTRSCQSRRPRAWTALCVSSHCYSLRASTLSALQSTRDGITSHLMTTGRTHRCVIVCMCTLTHWQARTHRCVLMYRCMPVDKMDAPPPPDVFASGVRACVCACVCLCVRPPSDAPQREHRCTLTRTHMPAHRCAWTCTGACM